MKILFLLKYISFVVVNDPFIAIETLALISDLPTIKLFIYNICLDNIYTGPPKAFTYTEPLNQTG